MNSVNLWPIRVLNADVPLFVAVYTAILESDTFAFTLRLLKICLRFWFSEKKWQPWPFVLSKRKKKQVSWHITCFFLFSKTTMFVHWVHTQQLTVQWPAFTFTSECCFFFQHLTLFPLTLALKVSRVPLILHIKVCLEILGYCWALLRILKKKKRYAFCSSRGNCVKMYKFPEEIVSSAITWVSTGFYKCKGCFVRKKWPLQLDPHPAWG